jgi:hypothetical protein
MEYQEGPTEYQLNGISDNDVQKEVDKFLQLVASDANAQKEVKDARLSLTEVQDALRGAGSEKPIQINPTGAGLDPLTTAVAIAAVKVGSKVLLNLWSYVLLPRIRRRYGDQSIKPIDRKS